MHSSWLRGVWFKVLDTVDALVIGVHDFRVDAGFCVLRMYQWLGMRPSASNCSPTWRYRRCNSYKLVWDTECSTPYSKNAWNLCTQASQETAVNMIAMEVDCLRSHAAYLGQEWLQSHVAGVNIQPILNPGHQGIIAGHAQVVGGSPCKTFCQDQGGEINCKRDGVLTIKPLFN
jgi:hypothetical protein